MKPRAPLAVDVSRHENTILQWNATILKWPQIRKNGSSLTRVKERSWLNSTIETHELNCPNVPGRFTR